MQVLSPDAFRIYSPRSRGGLLYVGPHVKMTPLSFVLVGTGVTGEITSIGRLGRQNMTQNDAFVRKRRRALRDSTCSGAGAEQVLHHGLKSVLSGLR